MKRSQDWESIVFTDTNWSNLRYRDVEPDSVFMFTINLDGSGYREFEYGKDYEADFKEGKLRRTPESRIGDYSNSPFFGDNNFNHNNYGKGNYGNYPFTVYVSYVYDDESNILTEDVAKRITTEAGFPRIRDMKAFKKLQNGGEITYTVIGDSISTGSEAIYKRHAYFSRFAKKLENITGGKVNVINKAVGSENSINGFSHFITDIEDSDPQLITIAYGINDMHLVNGENHIGDSLVPVKEFHDHIVRMIETAQKRNIEVILVNNAIPNPSWKFCSSREYEYPEEMRCIAKEYSLPLADTRKLWESELRHGKTVNDLLLDDINHPTTYGHGLYAQMLFSLI